MRGDPDVLPGVLSVGRIDLRLLKGDAFSVFQPHRSNVPLILLNEYNNSTTRATGATRATLSRKGLAYRWLLVAPRAIIVLLMVLLEPHPRPLVLGEGSR